ncbi:hypothetical protein [Rhizobium viscosum]|uniref:Uncharacterized protein n=1 Tax=Rhizobium viscosum TaxID=1673 RepID=A0ABR9IV35_RHIVS|nr:hypothetical protein [Rhizobium viscosum]MBE1507064.1 hypothetical protein [Rhizobium viscosum]
MNSTTTSYVNDTQNLMDLDEKEALLNEALRIVDGFETSIDQVKAALRSVITVLLDDTRQKYVGFAD